MRHNPIDQIYAEIVAARECKVTLIIEAIKNLRRSIESKQAQIDKHQAKVAALEIEAAMHRLTEPESQSRYLGLVENDRIGSPSSRDSLANYLPVEWTEYKE